MEHNPDIGAPPPVWTRLRFEARAAAADEPTMASYIDAAILSQKVRRLRRESETRSRASEFRES